MLHAGAAAQDYGKPLVYQVPVGKRLEALPGYSQLMPTKKVPKVAISLTPVTFKVGDAGGAAVTALAPVRRASAAPERWQGLL